jgi:glycosyltransferase involved in cell wall biosynthesis
MHIVLTIPNLSSSVGGPATVVQNLSEQLVSLGVSVTVMTRTVVPGQSEVLPRDQTVDIVHIPGNGERPWRSLFGGLLKAKMGPDVATKEETIVHNFGLWMPANHAVATVCKSTRIPLVCSTCGMLAPWALRHKAWKKRLGWWLYQRRDLSHAALLVATAEQEVRDIRRVMPKKNIALMPNGVELPEGVKEKLKAGEKTTDYQTTGQREQKSEIIGQRSAKGDLRPEVGGRRTVVFLGRIHPVKGLKNLVEAWRLVQPKGWRCILAGPDEAGHQKELEALLRMRDLESIFEFPGMMNDGQKWALFREADLFVLPSFTENFGVSAAEALAAGVPVITTKGTPWEELRTRKCGWWIDIGVEPLAAALRDAISLSDQERHEMGQRGRRLVQEKYSWPQIGRDMLAVYQWVLGKGSQPSCVCLG